MSYANLELKMKQFHKQWSSVFLRGVLAILFGIVAVFWPGLGLQILVLVFGAYALVDGIFAFLVGISYKSVALTLEGLVGVIIGLLIFFYTLQAAAIFVLLVGIWAVATGIFEVIAGLELRKHIGDEIFLLFVGIVSIIFGFFVFVNPIAAGLALTWVIGVYALLFGSLLVALSIRLKNYRPSSGKRKR